MKNLRNKIFLTTYITYEKIEKKEKMKSENWI